VSAWGVAAAGAPYSPALLADDAGWRAVVGCESVPLLQAAALRANRAAAPMV